MKSNIPAMFYSGYIGLELNWYSKTRIIQIQKSECLNLFSRKKTLKIDAPPDGGPRASHGGNYATDSYVDCTIRFLTLIYFCR